MRVCVYALLLLLLSHILDIFLIVIICYYHYGDPQNESQTPISGLVSYFKSLLFGASMHIQRIHGQTSTQPVFFHIKVSAMEVIERQANQAPFRTDTII